MSYRTRSSRPFVFAASSNMVRQYGQAEAITAAPAASARANRRWVIFSPGPSSLPILPTRLHLDRPDAGQTQQDIPWLLVDSVVSAEVARVVVRDEGLEVLRGRQASLSEQFLEEHGVVDDLVRPAEVGVFVSEGVEAVRTSRDDLPDLGTLQRLHARFDEGLGQVFVPDPSRRIAGGGL